MLNKTYVLTHISLASFLWEIGKQCRSRSDAAERGVSSGSPLFAYRILYQDLKIAMKHTTQTPLKRKWTRQFGINGLKHLKGVAQIGSRSDVT